MAFSLVLARRPPSAGSHGRKLFQAFLRQEATARVAGQPMLQRRLYCRISWFHALATRQDIDNIAKGVIDGLKGVVFPDDVSIVRCLLTKIDLTQQFAFDSASVGTNDYNDLWSFLNAGHNDVLAIEVGEIATLELRFGAVEGDLP